MTEFKNQDLQKATFVDVDLRKARFVESVLTGVVMRGVDVSGVDLDAPWLEDDSSLLVNGVDVAPYVDAELNNRFPGRAERRAEDPDGLRSAWAAVQGAWDAALERAAAMPDGTVEQSVDGEWSFAQTLRHLVLATDMWIRGAALEIEAPYHPLGLVDRSAEEEGMDLSVFSTETPTYAEVLEARASRVAMVRDYLESVTPEMLAAKRTNPHAPEYPETVLSCLHTVLEEEWAHLRFALRDLDAIEARSPG